MTKEENKLFTIYVEYDGNTYLAQEEAASPSEAVMFWSRNEKSKGFINQLNKSERIELQQDFYYSDLIPVEGLINTWCDSTTISDKLVLLHCTQTDRETC